MAGAITVETELGAGSAFTVTRAETRAGMTLATTRTCGVAASLPAINDLSAQIAHRLGDLVANPALSDRNRQIARAARRFGT